MEFHLRVGDLAQDVEEKSVIGLVVHVDPRDLFGGEDRIVSILCNDGTRKVLFSSQLKRANV